jgi:hypothetical protein
MSNDATSGIYNSVLPTLTNGQQSRLQVDSSSRLIVSAAGTAGTAGGGVQSVQGVAGMLPVTSGGVYASVGGTLTKSTKTTAYSSGQLIAQSATAGSCSGIALAVARINDGTGMVRRLRLKTTDATWLNATIRVHLYKDTPTFANGDAGNWAAGTTESNYIGYSDIVLDRSFSNAVKGIGTPASGSEWNFEPSTGTQNIYAVLEARSTSAGSHTASSVFTLVAETLQN